jgi:hypothetical protein
MTPPIPTCIGLHLDCQTMVKGVLVVIAGFTMFIGSVYIVLSAIFGRWMGYLIVAVSLSGWLILLSALWFFGFWSQGIGTPTNLGPRGAEPAWIALEGSLAAAKVRYPTFASYPRAPWKEPTPSLDASVQSVQGAVSTFLAEQANVQLDIDPLALNAIQTTQFTVENIRFAPDGKVSLAVAQAYFNGGGPLITVMLYHDSGSVPHYSAEFLFAAILLFLIHLPLLDKAEKKRKQFLVGGNAPPWYGPA